MFRIDPKLPAGAMKTYAIHAPISTHYRPATCQEVDCEAYAHGWKTRIDPNAELGRKQLNYIRLGSGRSFRVVTSPGTPIVDLIFSPGQQCFAQHQVPLEREPFYIVRDGDFRGNPRGTTPRKLSAPHWVDDFATHQDTIATALGDG